MIRVSKVFALSAILLGLATGSARAQSLVNIQFLGERIVPNGQTVGGTVVGGLSGLDYDSVTGQYVSNSDDQAAPRFYTLSADITSTAFNGVTINSVTALTNLNGQPAFANGNNDLENIRLSQNRQSVYVTSEGNAGAGLTTSTYEFDRATGAAIRNIDAPAQFAPTMTNGIRPNLGFESQTFFANDFTRFLTAAEGPLRQDTTPVAGTNPNNIFNVAQPLRLARFNTATGAAEAQFAYLADALTEPVFADTVLGVNQFGVQGLVDVLAIAPDRFLGLERSFTVGGTAGGGTGYSIRLYEFSLAGATDISGLSSLLGPAYTPVQKNLLLDFATLPGITLDNIEGMTLGPDLGNGQRALLFVSDNNFQPFQKTQFLAFGVTVAPEPGTFALIGAATLPLLGLVVIRRRRRA